MWLNKFLTNLRLRIIALSWRDVSQHKPNRKLCTELLETLSSAAYRSHTLSTSISTTLNVRYATIDLYTKRLEEATKAIKFDQAISHEWAQVDGKNTSINDFFVSSDGYYLNPVKSIDQFKHAGLAFCSVFAKTEGEEVGLQEHNNRMLRPLLANLQETTRVLIEISLHN